MTRSSDTARFTCALVVNPVAGIGGPAGLKGSDGAVIQAEARARGSNARAEDRAVAMLRALGAQAKQWRWLTWGGAMGADALTRADLPHAVLGVPAGAGTIGSDHEPGTGAPQPWLATAPADTAAAVARLAAAGPALLIFVGGDGTARDVCGQCPADQLVLGVPAGVKMHSGVFAIDPLAAAKIVAALANGGLVSVAEGQVRDIDEDELRRGRPNSRYYGTMRVAQAAGFLQHVKEGGREVDELVALEIAADFVARAEDTCFVLGPGSTTLAVKQALTGRDEATLTLLGVDVIQNGELVATDVDEAALFALVNTPGTVCMAIVSPIGGQGFVFGRGNQQFSARVLHALGRKQIEIVATRRKLLSLQQRPLLIDSGDAELDAAWSGLIEVTTGFEDRLMYRLASSADVQPNAS